MNNTTWVFTSFNNLLFHNSQGLFWTQTHEISLHFRAQNKPSRENPRFTDQMVKLFYSVTPNPRILITLQARERKKSFLIRRNASNDSKWGRERGSQIFIYLMDDSFSFFFLLSFWAYMIHRILTVHFIQSRGFITIPVRVTGTSGVWPVGPVRQHVREL